jgi:carboxymethylenebutenolidase
MAADIETSMITVRGLNAYLSRPAGGSTGGMLLVPMITGLSGQLREFADDLAASGVTTLSWDPWHGRPSGDETPYPQLAEWMSELDDEACLAEFGQLTDHLFGELGCQRVGAIGWCMGGRFVLLFGSRDERLANIVAYHPTVPGTPAPNHTISAVEAAATIAAPVMMLYPGADHLVPRESFDRLQAALLSRPSAPSFVHHYPGAEHGFSAKARHGNEVNRIAARLAWPQAVAFIRSTTLDQP